MNDIENYKSSNELMSYNDFSFEIDKLGKPDKLADNISDHFSKIPQSVKSLTNFDPTGISSYLSDLLENNKAQRESEAIKKALFVLYRGIKKLEYKFDKIYHEKSDILYEEYLNIAKKSPIDKIDFLKNAILYGLFSNSRIEDDVNMMNLINSLSIVQINIFAIASRMQYDINYSDLRKSSQNILSIKGLSNELNGDESIIKRHCLDLIGKGLLEDWGIGRLDYHGPENFIINEYTKVLIDYVKGYGSEER